MSSGLLPEDHVHTTAPQTEAEIKADITNFTRTADYMLRVILRAYPKLAARVTTIDITVGLKALLNSAPLPELLDLALITDMDKLRELYGAPLPLPELLELAKLAKYATPSPALILDLDAILERHSLPAPEGWTYVPEARPDRD